MMRRVIQLKTDNRVLGYKTFLAEVIAKRPSGIKRRLAEALNTNPSFISQITSPNYRIPIPYQHLSIIIKLLHLSQEEKEEFLHLYHTAHPIGLAEDHREDDEDMDKLIIHLPRFKDEKKAREVKLLIEQFADRVIVLINRNDK